MSTPQILHELVEENNSIFLKNIVTQEKTFIEFGRLPKSQPGSTYQVVPINFERSYTKQKSW